MATPKIPNVPTKVRPLTPEEQDRIKKRALIQAAIEAKNQLAREAELAVIAADMSKLTPSQIATTTAIRIDSDILAKLESTVDAILESTRGQITVAGEVLNAGTLRGRDKSLSRFLTVMFVICNKALNTATKRQAESILKHDVKSDNLGASDWLESMSKLSGKSVQDIAALVANGTRVDLSGSESVVTDASSTEPYTEEELAILAEMAEAEKAEAASKPNGKASVPVTK